MRLARPMVLSSLLAAAAAAQPVQMTPMPSGAMQKTGYYMPLRITLSGEQPQTVTKLPPELAAPQFGVIEIAGREGARYHVVVDEPVGSPARLYVDSNGNGDLADDPATEWSSADVEGPAGEIFKQYGGGATVDLGTEEQSFHAHLGMYRFDPRDPRRAQLKDVLLYYRDYALEGPVTLGERTFQALLNDDGATGDFRGKAIDAEAPEASSGVVLMLDVNDNGKFDSRGERFDVRRPFNIGGVTYEIADLATNGRSFNVVKSSKTVAEVLTPPDHAVGKKITPFEATTMDGKSVHFPEDYKGKIVMIDFWATWCGPCMAEVPNVVAAYEKFHGSGFEVLGISLDKKDQEETIRKVTGQSKMTWPQVYDGGFWKARVAEMYAIDGIPAVFLVDGDTGEILAEEGHLRGQALLKTIEEQLAKKNKNG